MQGKYLRNQIRPLISRIYSLYFRHVFRSEKAPLPRQIHLEITWNCNLECIMCPRTHGQPFKVKAKNLSLATFKEIIQKNPSIRRVNFIGAGEPLVHPDFYEMLEILDSEKIGVMFTTNGTLLDEDRIRKLPPNIEAVYFSIDSATPQTYKAIRGAELGATLENVQLLRKIRKEIKICIQALMMRENIDRLIGLIDVAEEIDANVSFINLLAFDETLDKQHISNVEEYPKIHEEILKKAENKQIRICPPYPQKNECVDPWVSPMISVTGDIYPCCYIYEGRGGVQTFQEYLRGVPIDVPMYQYCLGNISQNTLAEMWNGKSLRLLRKTILETKSMNLASYEELNNLRKTINLTEKYAYCRICLYRWGCAC